MTAASKIPPIRSSSDGTRQAPTRCLRGEGQRPKGRNGRQHLGSSWSRGPGTQGRTTEIALGRAFTRQGLAATCKDLSNKGVPEIEGRVKAWRMSPYERRRKGNAFREGARRLPHQGNTDMGQRDSGHLAVTGSVNWETGMSHHRDQPAKQTTCSGAYVCQHLSIAVGRKACRAMPRSEPSRGNPAARDRREACGNVSMMGAGLRPSGKPLD